MEIPVKYVWFSLNSILIGHLNHSNRIRNEQVMAKIRNWSKQENQNRLYRYKSNLYRYKLAKNDQNRSCTGTSSNCTSTSLRKVPRMCVFPIFHALSSMDHSYTSYTHQNHSKLTLESLLYSNHLSILIFLPNSFMNHFKNHSNMGDNPYTNQIQRFVKVCSKP